MRGGGGKGAAAARGQRTLSSFFFKAAPAAPAAAAAQGAVEDPTAAETQHGAPQRAGVAPVATPARERGASARGKQKQKRPQDFAPGAPTDARCHPWTEVAPGTCQDVEAGAPGEEEAPPGRFRGGPPLSPSARRERLRSALAPAAAPAEVDGSGDATAAFYQPPPGARGVSYTPLERQVLALQREHPGVLLMVEVGYKYQFFGEDAAVAAKHLGIWAHRRGNFLNASVPTFRLHIHCRRLCEAGYKVGVVRQTDTAALKAASDKKSGPFERTLSAVYTHATIDAQADLGASAGEVAKQGGGGGGGGGGGSGGSGGGVGWFGGRFRVKSNAEAAAEGPTDAERYASGEGGVGGDETDRATSGELSSHLLVIAGVPSSGSGGARPAVGVVTIECSTGEVFYGSADARGARAEVEGRLVALRPREVVVVGECGAPVEALVRAHSAAGTVRVERLSVDGAVGASAAAAVADFYCEADSARKVPAGLAAIARAKRSTLDDMLEDVMRLPEATLVALAAGLKYLSEFKLSSVTLAGRPAPYAAAGEMRLGANALRQLEVLTNSGDGSERGSLIALLDRTLTAAGGRALRRWVMRPLSNVAAIVERHGAVECLVASLGGVARGEDKDKGQGGDGDSDAGALARAVKATLKGLPDMERALMRVVHQTATPRELVSTLRTLLTATRRTRACPPTPRSPLLSRLISAAADDDVEMPVAAMLAELDEAAAQAGDKQNIFPATTARARFPALAEAREMVTAAEEALEALLPGIRRQTKKEKLVYKTVHKEEYLVEVPTSLKVPSDWALLSSTKQHKRYRPAEVAEGMRSLARARERRAVAANEAWAQFLRAVGTHYAPLAAAVRSLAALDALLSLAAVAATEGYVRPNVPSQSVPAMLRLEGAIHPVLAPLLGNRFVPNDFELGAPPARRCLIVTGPNMGGKSTAARSLAMCALMSQAGSFVPAASASLSALDALYTRMGASDNIMLGRSTFLEELNEAGAALSGATCRSLVILDELGRGTSTYDGAAIAYATLSYLAERTRCLTVFATHYPDVVRSLVKERPADVATSRMDYVQEAGEAGEGGQTVPRVTLLYRMVPGIADRSFGVSVARMAGVPQAVVAAAAAKAKEFEEQTEKARAKARAARGD